ncbi:EcsC family protein [Peribacillus saganii]|uniref:EcsC family protein n=1 Tax=Peribacillus saganii TaxID=2303992 RepID=A0A372LTP0_9BACI|nr:EcsC family protein [Peribacillus saganii]RFU71426.1 EcsC family protein [Peribacillus saganii]
MHLESKELLKQELMLIEKWEGNQKGLWFWERLGRLPFKILDKLTPSFIQSKIGAMLDELGSFIQNGGQYLTSEKTVLKKIQQLTSERQIMSIADVQRVPLAVMAAVSEDLKKSRGKAATVQGAATGLGGLFTLALDIPVLLGLSLKTLQEIAIIHGYDPNDRTERMFIVKCLQFTSADIVGKEAILNELSNYNKAGSRPKEMMSQLQGWREVVYTYRDQFGWKKLLQMVPVAGMIFGALTNRSMVQDIAETGTMLYRKRRILDRLKEFEEKA